MRLKPTSAVAFACAACAMIVTSCATDVTTDVNIDPAGNAISFAPSVGHSTRATETTISNLGDFAVIARGMHPDGVLYDSYLIGSRDEGGEIAKFNSLASDGKSGIWQLDRKIYWPASMKRALFIGYTTLKRNNKNVSESSTNGVLGSAAFGVSEADKPYISGFSPLKNKLTDAAVNGAWADGESQKDLVVAFKQQDWSLQSTVPLNFRHALTQVSIEAIQKDKDEKNDNRIVKVKGAWIVNAAKTGTLTATINIDKTNDEHKASNKTTWSVTTDKETYGAYYTDYLPLEKENAKELLRQSLMLIPESLNEWDHTEGGTGAYIMLLCRIELEHDGKGHADVDISDTGISGEKHYHQLFPVNATMYDGSEYGFICVPISTDWGEVVENQDDCKGAGKHYTYTLDICGATTGAGLYPPTQDASKLIPANPTVSALVLNATKGEYETQTVALKVVQTRPTGKYVGSKVLDDPIKFSVSVTPWKNETGSWTDGTAEPDETEN